MYSLTAWLDGYFFSLPLIYRCLIIIAFIAVAAAIAYRKKMLTPSGVAAAAVLGFAVFFIGGTSCILVFLFFFVTASIASRLLPVPVGIVRKGSERDWVQVAANGVPAAAMLILYRFQGWDGIYLIAFASAVAEAEADTFASSFGLLSRKPPRSIITGTIVPPGISGGITSAGTLASLAGAFLVALLSMSSLMLSILESENRDIRLGKIEKFGHNRGNPAEEGRPTGAAERAGKPGLLDPGGRIGIVHLAGVGRENHIRAVLGAKRRVAIKIAGITVEILGRSELGRVDEDRHDDHIAAHLDCRRVRNPFNGGKIGKNDVSDSVFGFFCHN